MQNTPQSNRLHVTIFGETNSGKSALFNAITGTNTAIVSDISGTTTDPVTKSMELLPFGPIVLTDTAGLNDKSKLGKERMAKTKTVLERTDLGIYVIDIANYSLEEYDYIRLELQKRKTPILTVLTKKDLYSNGKLERESVKFNNPILVSANDNESITILKAKICTALSEITDREESLIGGLVDRGGVVIMVTPIDSEAPKGRLILPQVQLIRDCLDNGLRCNVTTVEFLGNALIENPVPDLVVTDSQAFKEVVDILPPNVPLTSFSILMARQKGDLDELVKGLEEVKKLKDNDRILIAEVCTHNRSHEDIGHVKIPNMLKKITGKALQFDFVSGRDFPENLGEYAMIVHCGGCMVTKKEINNRIQSAKAFDTPITNYGVLLAMGNGILERSLEILLRR